MNQEVVNESELIRGREAENLCARLAQFVDQVGVSDGIQMAIDAGPIALDTNIIGKVRPWLENPATPPHALWIEAPYECGMQTTARSVAMRFVQILKQAEAPFISCFCTMPMKSMIPEFQGTSREAGILAMVYSLILQLLQFRPPGFEQTQLYENELMELDEDMRHWDTALKIFATLLDSAPNPLYCNISGLIDLEYDTDKCREFLDVLFSRTQAVPRQIFLTTSGQSRLLPNYIERGSTVVTELNYEKMKRIGTIR